MQTCTVVPLIHIAPGPHTSQVIARLATVAAEATPASTAPKSPSLGLACHLAWADEGARKTLEDLIKGKHLTLWPTVFAGAPPTRLFPDELEREISLGLKAARDLHNGTGRETDPIFFLPHQDSRWREPFSKHLTSLLVVAGTRILGMGHRQATGFLGDRVLALDLMAHARDIPGTPRTALAILSCSNPEDVDQIPAILRTYREAGIAVLSAPVATDLEADNGPSDTPLGSLVPEPPALLPSTWILGYELGRTRSRVKGLGSQTGESLQDILTLAACPGHLDKLSAPQPRRRTHLASMQGLVTLSGQRSEIHFIEGSLLGFFRGNGHLKLAEPLAIARHKAWSFEPQGSVSLESDYFYGLHESRFCRKNPGLFVGVDYLHPLNSDWLYLDCRIHYPPLDHPIDDLTPLALEFDVGGPVEVRWNLGKDAQSLILRPPEETRGLARFMNRPVQGTWASCSGTDWTFAFGQRRLVLRFPGNPWDTHGMRVRMNRRGKRISLELSPFGSFTLPVSQPALAIDQRFCVALYASFDPNEEIPPLDQGIGIQLNEPSWTTTP